MGGSKTWCGRCGVGDGLAGTVDSAVRRLAMWCCTFQSAAHCRLQATPHCTAHYCTTALALVDTMHCTILHYSCTVHYCTGLGWAGLTVLPSPFCNAHYTRLALDWHQTLVRECRSALSYKGCTALYCTALAGLTALHCTAYWSALMMD